MHQPEDSVFLLTEGIRGFEVAFCDLKEPCHTPGAALQKAARNRQVWSKSERRQVPPLISMLPYVISGTRTGNTDFKEWVDQEGSGMNYSETDRVYRAGGLSTSFSNWMILTSPSGNTALISS